MCALTLLIFLFIIYLICLWAQLIISLSISRLDYLWFELVVLVFYEISLILSKLYHSWIKSMLHKKMAELQFKLKEPKFEKKTFSKEE